MKTFVTHFTLISLLSWGLMACEPNQPATTTQDAGQALEQASEGASQAVDNALDSAGNTLDEARDSVRETDDAQNTNDAPND